MATQQIDQIPTPGEMCENKRRTYTLTIILAHCKQYGGEILQEIQTEDFLTVYTTNYKFTFKSRKGGKFAFYCVISNKREPQPIPIRYNEYKLRVRTPNMAGCSAIHVEMFPKTTDITEEAQKAFDLFSKSHKDVCVQVYDRDTSQEVLCIK